jgi:hypothetical protein
VAAITRRTLANLKTEVTLRLGNPNNTSINVEHYLWAAYLRLALTYHHFELDRVTSPMLTLSTTVNTLALPADCFIAIHSQVWDAAGTAALGWTTETDFATLVRDYDATAGRPEKHARFGSSLYFDKLPDVAYKVQLFYYGRPAAPDFAGAATSELDVEADEHLIEQAVILASGGTGTPSVELNRMLLDDWLAQQVRSSLLDPVSARRERRNTERTIGGAQG